MPNTRNAERPDDLIQEFGRRHRALKRTLAIALAAWAAAVLSVIAVSLETVPVWTPHALAAVALVLMVPYARAGSRYRCPACGATPSSEGERGMLLNPPPNCTDCGMRLR